MGKIDALLIGLMIFGVFISMIVVANIANKIMYNSKPKPNSEAKMEPEYKPIDINYEKRVLYSIIGYREVYENKEDPEYVYFGFPYPSLWISKEYFRALFPLMAENYDVVGWFQCDKTIDHRPFSLFLGGLVSTGSETSSSLNGNNKTERE